MDCGETSMRLTHQNRLKHLVPSLSHTGVNQDTHMLGACNASFNHINSVLWFRPYPHHDLTTLRVSVHQRSYSKSPTKLITVSVAVKACSSRSVSKLTRATLRRRIMNVIATPRTHPTPPPGKHHRLPESTLQIISLWGSCVLLLLFDRARKCANMIHLLNGVACLQKQTVHSGWIPWRWGSALSWPAWQQLIECCP